MTFRFIEEHKDRWPVRLLCETLEVSPAGYYAGRGRPRSAQEQRHDALLVEVRAVHAELKARYGSPRMHAELVARGHACCVNTVAKLMRDNDIRAKTARKFRVRTTDSDHGLQQLRQLPAGAARVRPVLQPGDHLGQAAPRAAPQGLHGRP